MAERSRALCAFKPMILRAALLFSVYAVALPLASGREIVRLQNGYSFDANSHSEERDTFRFTMGNGSIQIAKGEIQNIEVTPDDPPASKGRATMPSAKATEELLREAATAQGVDAAFIRSVAKIESGLRQNAVSARGARGLMQLMPGTAAELGVDSSEAGTNAMGGAMYLRKLLLQYKGDSGLALAAYNAGPGAVEKYRGIPPYAETRRYILKVLDEYKRQLGRQAASLAAISKPSAID